MSNKIININTAPQKASEHEIECLKCGKLIPKASRKCIYCGVNYSKEISEIVYETSPRKKRTALIIVALLLIILLLFFL
jgi:predicted nucleic acid-binding Zn ribbon protein